MIFLQFASKKDHVQTFAQITPSGNLVNLRLGSHRANSPPPIFNFLKIVQVSVSKRQGCRAIKEACCFFFRAKIPCARFATEFWLRKHRENTEAELASGHTGNSMPIQGGQYNKLYKSKTRIEFLGILVPAQHWVLWSQTMMLLILIEVACSLMDGNPDVWIIPSFPHLHGSKASH